MVHLTDQMSDKYLWWSPSKPRSSWIPYAESPNRRPEAEQEAAVKRLMVVYKDWDMGCSVEDGEEHVIEALRRDWAGTVRQLRAAGY